MTVIQSFGFASVMRVTSVDNEATFSPLAARRFWPQRR